MFVLLVAGIKGVANCILVHNNSVLHASSPADELGLVANLNAMLSTTRDISKHLKVSTF